MEKEGEPVVNLEDLDYNNIGENDEHFGAAINEDEIIDDDEFSSGINHNHYALSVDQPRLDPKVLSNQKNKKVSYNPDGFNRDSNINQEGFKIDLEMRKSECTFINTYNNFNTDPCGAGF